MIRPLLCALALLTSFACKTEDLTTPVDPAVTATSVDKAAVRAVPQQEPVRGILQVDNTRAEFERPVTPIGESVTCAAGECTYACKAGKTCSATCAGGKCDHTCGEGSVCHFSCKGGGCTQTCLAGSTCHLKCQGGDCKRSCENSKRCNKACKGSGCTG